LTDSGSLVLLRQFLQSQEDALKPYMVDHPLEQWEQKRRQEMTLEELRKLREDKQKAMEKRDTVERMSRSSSVWAPAGLPPGESGA
jgi:hypothetical protein